jgi:hypothetical protein
MISAWLNPAVDRAFVALVTLALRGYVGKS